MTDNVTLIKPYPVTNKLYKDIWNLIEAVPDDTSTMQIIGILETVKFDYIRSLPTT